MLVSTESGGLGNRIKSWVSAMRLDSDARVFWPATDNMPAAFGDLFANDCGIGEIPDTASEHCSWQLAVVPDDYAELPAGFASVVSSAPPLWRRAHRLTWTLRGRPDDRFRYMVAPKRFSRRLAGSGGRIIDFEYDRIPDYFRRIYAPLFASITVLPGILERVDAFARSNMDQDVIGVQIRTWRDAPRRHRKHHRPAVRRLERLLQGAGDERRFFVVSDDDEIVSWLRRQVGEKRVLSFPREMTRRNSWESMPGMVEDLIDMLLLARTGEFFASYLSTFSETAWWLGGAIAKVSVF